MGLVDESEKRPIDIMDSASNSHGYRRTDNIIFTNRRLRRFFRMLIEHVQAVLEKRNGQNNKHKDTQGG